MDTGAVTAPILEIPDEIRAIYESKDRAYAVRLADQIARSEADWEVAEMTGDDEWLEELLERMAFREYYAVGRLLKKHEVSESYTYDFPAMIRELEQEAANNNTKGMLNYV